MKTDTLNRMLADGAARDPKCPLHPEFEWNDETAGKEYRTPRQRASLFDSSGWKSSSIGKRDWCRTTSSIRREPRSKRYVELQVVSRDRAMALRVFQDELDRIVACIRRAQDIAATLGLDDDLEKFLDSWSELKTAAESKKAAAEAKKKAKKGGRSRRGSQSELRA